MFFMELKYQNIYLHLISETLRFTIHHKVSFTLNTNYSCLDVQWVMCMVSEKPDKYFESDSVHETESLCLVSQPAKWEWHEKHAEVFLTRVTPVCSPSRKHWVSFYESTCSPEALFLGILPTLLLFNMTVEY